MGRLPHEASVLVVEDNLDNLFITLELLRTKARVGYCAGCATGDELWALIETLADTQIDLILLDLQLSNEDGYAVLRRIRALPRLHDTRVVALTANVMAADLRRARSAGFDGFIGKPIGAQRFPQQIARILRGEPVWEARA